MHSPTEWSNRISSVEIVTSCRNLSRHSVESAGPFLDPVHLAPNRVQRVPDGDAGPVIALIELGDEEEAGAGVSGRHARKVNR